MHNGKKRWLTSKIGIAVTCTAVAAAAVVPMVASAMDSGRYVAGDFHTHTYLTDGSKTQLDVVHHAFDDFGLDWMANSEHGGTSKRDAFGNPITTTWRWITINTQSWPLVRDLREIYADKMLVQGVEWNVPTHEHASVGIVANEPTAVSDFEYLFDASDKDTSRVGMSKDNTSHAGAVNGVAWLQANYPTSSYMLLNHPSRRQAYNIAALRDLNNAGPDVAFGFEGMPGHQKEPGRGGYDNNITYPGNSTVDPAATARARTYGGADFMSAEVGGVWDALLGEGRHWWTFVNSDFHNTDGDFWPGEYAKSHTLVNGEGYESLVDGLRSGNSFSVHGDLIDELRFTANASGDTAEMGSELDVKKGKTVRVAVRFHVPAANNNGDAPKVDHIDLVRGNVTGKATPGTAEYNNDKNPSAKVTARFSSDEWKARNAKGSWYTVVYTIKPSSDCYLRLRGTNLGIGVPNETDAVGNPLVDDSVGPNDAQKAYDDLWFYSNPIFIDVQ